MNKLYHAIIGVEELSDDTNDGDVENEAELSDDVSDIEEWCGWTQIIFFRRYKLFFMHQLWKVKYFLYFYYLIWFLLRMIAHQLINKALVWIVIIWWIVKIV